MRVSGHHGVGLLLRESEESVHEPGNRRADLVDGVAYVQAQIQCELIVAAGRGVQLAANRSHQLDEPALDRHVDVFIRRYGAKVSAIELGANLLEAAANSRRVGGRDD